MAGARQGRRPPPLPQPLRPRILVPAMALGVIGTGLLYRAATGGGLVDLLVGAALFATGLRLAGRPFVLAATWHHERRRGWGRDDRSSHATRAGAPARKD